MIFYLSIFIYVTHIFGRILIARKIWYAPIYCVCQEGFWIILFGLIQSGTWPLILLSLTDAAIYIWAVPKWRRERKISLDNP